MHWNSECVCVCVGGGSTQDICHMGITLHGRTVVLGWLYMFLILQQVHMSMSSWWWQRYKSKQVPMYKTIPSLSLRRIWWYPIGKSHGRVQSHRLEQVTPHTVRKLHGKRAWPQGGAKNWGQTVQPATISSLSWIPELPSLFFQLPFWICESRYHLFGSIYSGLDSVVCCRRALKIQEFSCRRERAQRGQVPKVTQWMVGRIGIQTRLQIPDFSHCTNLRIVTSVQESRDSSCMLLLSWTLHVSGGV